MCSKSGVLNQPRREKMPEGFQLNVNYLLTRRNLESPSKLRSIYLIIHRPHVVWAPLCWKLECLRRELDARKSIAQK